MQKRKDFFHDLLLLNSAIILFGAAGLFGKILLMPASMIVWGRALLAGLFLITLKRKVSIPRKQERTRVLITGIILALHWFSFFKSIQLSSVALGLITYALFPVFVPWIKRFLWPKSPIGWIDYLLPMGSLAGIIIMTLPFLEQGNRISAMLWGITSAGSFALLTILNEQLITKYAATEVAMWQNITAAIILTPWVIVLPWDYPLIQYGILFILGILFTGVAHTLFIRGLRTAGSMVAAPLAMLEPLYGILLSWLLLNIPPLPGEIVGGSIIIGSALMAIIYHSKKFKPSAKH